MSGVYKAFLEYETVIRRVLARYASRPDTVDDLAQQTFLKCYAAEMKEEIREPKAFLLRVAKNVALSEVRRHVNTMTDSLEDFESSNVLKDERHSSPETEVDARRKLEVAAHALESLPAECRQALIMRKVEKLRFKQIATRLEVSVSTVEKRVAKALVLCNGWLRAHGYDPEEFGEALKGKGEGEAIAMPQADRNECESHD